MVQIYVPYYYTWIIPTETLQQLKQDNLKSGCVTKFCNVFSNVGILLRAGYCFDSFQQKPAYYFEFIIFASKTSANICISIKSANVKHRFKNVTYRSEVFHLPCDIMDPAKKIIVDGKCEIEISGMFIIGKAIPTIPRMTWKNKEKDFDIIVINDEEKKEEKIQIHKDVLIVQSPYFEAMFNSGMLEATTNTLKIIDFDCQTVKLAVEFFYGHDFPNFVNYDNIMELYRFADKYFIDNLMDYITAYSV